MNGGRVINNISPIIEIAHHIRWFHQFNLTSRQVFSTSLPRTLSCYLTSVVEAGFLREIRIVTLEELDLSETSLSYRMVMWKEMTDDLPMQSPQIRHTKPLMYHTLVILPRSGSYLPKFPPNLSNMVGLMRIIQDTHAFKKYLRRAAFIRRTRFNQEDTEL